jgi:hypothetical protein
MGEVFPLISADGVPAAYADNLIVTDCENLRVLNNLREDFS